MKRKNKFIVLSLVVCVFFGVLCCVVCSTILGNIRIKHDEDTFSVIAAVREKYPDLTTEEIVDILNFDGDTEPTRDILSGYGIDINDGAIFIREKNDFIPAIAACTAVCVAGGLVLIVLMIFLDKLNRKEIGELTDYVRKINNGNYDLYIEKNTETELSVLRNEIFKTTVTLRESSENSIKDRQRLKESLSNISHQIKTPITSILIMTENLLSDDNMPLKLRREFLLDIRHSANSTKFMVQSILNLSRFDANAVEMYLKEEKLSEVFSECIEQVEILAELKEIELLSDDENHTILCCDKRWFCQALVNIIKNCIEHTDRGGRIRIYTENDKLFTRIIITDNGCGISEKDVIHIFDRFYRGTSDDPDGAGIGLALSKKILDNHGFTVSVDSEINKGTRFTLRQRRKN